MGSGMLYFLKNTTLELIRWPRKSTAMAIKKDSSAPIDRVFVIVPRSSNIKPIGCPSNTKVRE